jgi:hypothetical protein
MNYFQEFSKYEDELIEKYEQHKLFTNIQDLSDEEFLSVLKQYGEGISAKFVMFLETAVRQIKNKESQTAILSILRDEIPAEGPTHQMMRSDAMEKGGVSAKELASTKLTEQTHNTLEKYFSFINQPEDRFNNHDLALTTFVRVIGESLVGVVYKHFTQELVRRFGVKEEEIEFYSFHWHHDEKGGTPVEGLNVGHTEYYDIAMEALLKTEEDLEEAKKIANYALEIREAFQNQFV